MFERRALQRAARPRAHRRPADVRDAQNAPVNALRGQTAHFAGDQMQSLHAGAFLARVEQHLHPETDAEQRHARGSALAQRVGKAALFQRVHAVPECADAGQHDAVRAVQRIGRRDSPGLKTARFQSAGHAQKIAHAIVDHTDVFHFRTSQPPSRSACFRSATCAFP